MIDKIDARCRRPKWPGNVTLRVLIIAKQRRKDSESRFPSERTSSRLRHDRCGRWGFSMKIYEAFHRMEASSDLVDPRWSEFERVYEDVWSQDFNRWLARNENDRVSRIILFITRSLPHGPRGYISGPQPDMTSPLSINHFWSFSNAPSQAYLLHAIFSFFFFIRQLFLSVEKSFYAKTISFRKKKNLPLSSQRRYSR